MTSDVEQALTAIADAHNGRLTPEAVVEAAREPASPLHKCFTWDQAEAAAKHRLYEARALIRSVRVMVTTESLTVRAPIFVRDPSASASSQGYVTVSALRTDEDLAREVVVAEFSAAASALARARAVAAALGVQEQIDTVRSMVIDLANRVAPGSV